jgi:hypothetical protein
VRARQTAAFSMQRACMCLSLLLHVPSSLIGSPQRLCMGPCAPVAERLPVALQLTKKKKEKLSRLQTTITKPLKPLMLTRYVPWTQAHD